VRSLKRLRIVALVSALLVAIAVIVGLGQPCHVDLTRIRLRALQLKIQAYQLDTGRVPAALDDLLTSNGVAGWQGPYARPADLRDVWDRPIDYRITTTLSAAAAQDGTQRRSLDF
jgi:general secretion pathway protein G